MSENDVSKLVQAMVEYLMIARVMTRPNEQIFITLERMILAAQGGLDEQRDENDAQTR